MRTKLIITVILLIALLFLVNWLCGRYLASLVDRQLQYVAEEDDRITLQYSSLNINPAFGSLTISNFYFQDNENRFETENIKVSLTYADIWRSIRYSSENPIAQIHSFRITANDVSVSRESIRNRDSGRNSSEVNFEDQTDETAIPADFVISTLNFVYSGRLDELLQLTENEHPPQLNHSFTLNLMEVSIRNEVSIPELSVPAVSDYQLPEEITRFHLQIHYLSNEKVVNLNSLQLVAPGLELQAGGNIRYGDRGWPGEPESGELDYELDASTRNRARLQLPGILGGFSMDSLFIDSDLQFHDSDSFKTGRLFSLPGQTSLHLSDIRWYPSDDLIEEYGMLFGMFNTTEQQLPIRSIQADYHTTSDTLRIDEAMLLTDLFDARIHVVMVSPGNRRPEILEGSVTFVRTGAAFNDFVDGIEGLFQIDLPRREGRIHLRFSGDPQSPDLNMNLQNMQSD